MLSPCTIVYDTGVSPERALKEKWRGTKSGLETALLCSSLFSLSLSISFFLFLFLFLFLSFFYLSLSLFSLPSKLKIYVPTQTHQIPKLTTIAPQ